MSVTKSLVEFTHDTGYGDDLLFHINAAIRGKDMRADRVVPPSPPQDSRPCRAFHKETMQYEDALLLGFSTESFSSGWNTTVAIVAWKSGLMAAVTLDHVRLIIPAE